MKQLSAILTILTQLKPELIEKYHVSSIGLFGSIVRDDFKAATSDVDIIVDFSQQVGVEFIDLADFIEHKLKLPVDLVSKKGVKERYFRQIEHEIVYG